MKEERMPHNVGTPHEAQHHMDSHIGEFPSEPPDPHSQSFKRGGKVAKPYHGTVNGYGLGNGPEASYNGSVADMGVEGGTDGVDDRGY